MSGNGRNPAGDDGLVPWREVLEGARQRLAAAGIDSAESEARRMVEDASGHEGAELTLVLREPATVGGVARVDEHLRRRLGGEPLQYVLGSWSFRALDLFVDGRVLIPRPETEVVAGLAIAELDRMRASSPSTSSRGLCAVDLGTGSGAIALAIAVECPGVEVWATDRSADALAVARSNLAGIGRRGTSVRLAEGWWTEALDPQLEGTLDLIVSNPPYVAADEVLPAEVADWEPTGALVAGPRGVEDLEHLVLVGSQWLAPTGSLVVELAPHQADPIAEYARSVGFAEVEVHPDLAGRDRAVVARSPLR